MRKLQGLGILDDLVIIRIRRLHGLEGIDLGWKDDMVISLVQYIPQLGYENQSMFDELFGSKPPHYIIGMLDLVGPWDGTDHCQKCCQKKGCSKDNLDHIYVVLK